LLFTHPHFWEAFVMSRIVVSVVVVCLNLVGGGRAHALDEEERRLLEEIVKTTQDEIEGMSRMIADGRIDSGAVIDAERRLATARLKLAATPEEELQIWEEIVQTTATSMQHIQRMIDAGQTTTIELYGARARHLEAQLGLYRARKAMSSNAQTLQTETFNAPCATYSPASPRRSGWIFRR
jgi:hypothetical protein